MAAKTRVRFHCGLRSWMTVVMVQRMPLMVPMPRMKRERKKRAEASCGKGISSTATANSTKARLGPLPMTWLISMSSL